jgi:hypothetical protein
VGLTPGGLLLLIDLVLALTALEAAALVGWHRRTGGGVAPMEVLPNLASGLCLMLALRSALAGWPWPFTLGGLAASGALHAWDLKRRWRRPGSRH